MMGEGYTPARDAGQPVDTATVAEVRAECWWDEATATTPIPIAQLRSVQPVGRIRRARDRQRWALRPLAAGRMVGFLALVVVVIMVMAANHDTPHDTSRSVERGSGSERGHSEDREPDDLPGDPAGALLGDVLGNRPGGAWPAGPFDMPISVPNARWQGWDRRPAGRCAWISPGLLDPLTFAARPEPTQSTCRLVLTSGMRVSILWAHPGARIVWDPFSELVARARGPAAGGTPWAPTPRVPSARAVAGTSACEPG